MSKVLVIVDNLEFGGVARVARNFSKSCSKKSDIKFDYICYIHPSKETERELEREGSNFYVIPRVSEVSFRKYIKNVRGIIKKSKEYRAVHIHTSYFIWLAALAAKKEGISIRIGHAHGSIGPYSPLIKKQKFSRIIQSRVVEAVGRIMNRRYCTHMLTCANESGDYTFGSGYEFIPNIIKYDDISLINESKKNSYYKEFNIPPNSIVIGYLGVIGLLKNTKLLVPIMKKIVEQNKSYYLIIAGDGPDKELIADMINAEGLSNNILMIGYRNDNHELLQFFDILVMPSFTEGMSLSILEAQVCSTPTITSSRVPDTNDIGVGLFYKTKSYDIDEWVDAIFQVSLKQNMNQSDEIIESIESSIYSENSIVSRLIEIYNE